MSQLIEGHGKKRRKSTAVDGVDEPLTKKSRKDPGSSTKPKKEKKHKKDKGKGKEKEQDIGEFRVVQASLVVSIPPVFANNPRTGVEEMLDSMVMRYIPALHGVILAHSSLHFPQRTAVIKADSPYAVCPVNFEATVWSPYVGMKLAGKINLCSPDHISLLVHRTFNVSIPRHHIPTDQWEFEYGPAENDPEWGPHAVHDDEDQVMEGDADGGPQTHEIEGGGRWVHKITGDRLGGVHRDLEFTVIGLTVANHMLSVLGSIQPDPFSPEHVQSHNAREEPLADVVPEAFDGDRDEEEEEAAMSDDVSDGEDPFARLGRMGDRAAEIEVQRRAAEMAADAVKKEKKNKKDKKKKRKKGGEDEDGDARGEAESEQGKKERKAKKKKT